MFHSGDELGAIVADIGSGSTRIGFAGDDVPRACFSTSFGVLGDEQKPLKERCVFNPFAPQEGMELRSPVVDGLVADWDLLEQTWDYALGSILRTELSGLPVLLAEKTYNTPVDRRKMAEYMFEKQQTAALFLAKDAALSCYACGKTSSLVVDCGASGTVVTPVHDGWTELKGVQRSNLGGRMMDSYLLQLLGKRLGGTQNYRLRGFLPSPALAAVANGLPIADSPSMAAWRQLELARDLRESVCRTAEVRLMDSEARYVNMPLTPYELPDGTTIDMGIERFAVPELFFEPSNFKVGVDDTHALLTLGPNPRPSPLPISALSLPTLTPTSSSNDSVGESLPTLICESVLASELDIQSTLFANLLFAGGNSNYDNLLDRCKQEVETRLLRLQKSTTKIKLFSNSKSERMISTWLGGSIMASLGSFHEIWVSKQDYEEYGAGIVDRKCP